MKTPTHEPLSRLRSEYPAGARVRLIQMDDLQAPPTGTLGEVICVDDVGTVHVNWNTGSSLGLVFGEDLFEKVRED